MTGCSSSSGWKMPGSKMFSWSKKPSETTLAGSGPSAIKYPDSPASKQNPQAIASAAAGTSSSKSALAATGTGARSAQPTYTPPNGMANVAFAPPAAAAAANGYSVGPYNTYSQPAGAANALASSGAPNGFAGGVPAAGMSPGNPYNTAAKSGFPSTQVYAGSPPGGLAANRGSQMPAGFQAPSTSTFAGAPPAGMPSQDMSGMPGQGMSGMPAQGMSGASFAAASSNPNPAFAVAPLQTGTPGFSMPQTMPTSGGYAPVGTSGMAPPPQGSFAASSSGSFPASSLSSGLSGIPGGQASSGMTSVPAQMAAYNSGSSAAGMSNASFRPGSTGRQTNYNFAQPAASNAVANQVPQMPSGQPAANTATGLNNPGFQIPPTSTFR